MGGQVFYDHGTIPEHLLKHFASRKAFIYALEVIAQVVAACTFARRLPVHWVAFVDNEAGRIALLKGFGRDPGVNALIATFWSLAAKQGWFPHFERVSSQANVSDPVSRANFSQATQEGWTREHTNVDLLYGLFPRAALDLTFACNEAAAEILKFSSS